MALKTRTMYTVVTFVQPKLRNKASVPVFNRKIKYMYEYIYFILQ